MTSQFTRILQLTDLHLFGDQETKLLGFNPYQSLQQVMLFVTRAVAKKQPTLLALTGDISQDYSPISYDVATKIFCDLNFPVIATMGNHDKFSIFSNFFGNPTQVFTVSNWRLIFLNSHWQEHISGRLAQEELDFLRNNLASSSEQHVIIFLHHPILPGNSTWLNKIMVSNAIQFLEIIDNYKNIKAVICGHIHSETSIERFGVSYFSTPSTSWQFAANSSEFKLDTAMPGYRYIDLYENGSFKTEVIRIDYNANFVPDLNSMGY